MKKILLCLSLVLLIILTCGCSKGETSGVSDNSEEKGSETTVTVSENEDISSNGTETESTVTSENENSNTASTTASKATSSVGSSSKSNVSYAESEWRLHPDDFKLLAFTFDDGPISSVVSGSQVKELVDLFKKYNGGATFFFAGKSVAANGENHLLYVNDNGSEVASHTYNHIGLTEDKDLATVDSEIKDGLDIIKTKANITARFTRTGGFKTSANVFTVATKYKTPIIDAAWSAGSDWSGGTATAESLKTSFGNKTFTGGEIIGMHSTHADHVSYKALVDVLPTLYAQGYRFVTVSELFELNGVKFEDIPTNKSIKKVYKSGTKVIIE